VTDIVGSQLSAISVLTMQRGLVFTTFAEERRNMQSLKQKSKKYKYTFSGDVVNFSKYSTLWSLRLVGKDQI
jgi:uncharacterized protein YvpB